MERLAAQESIHVALRVEQSPDHAQPITRPTSHRIHQRAALVHGNQTDVHRKPSEAGLASGANHVERRHIDSGNPAMAQKPFRQRTCPRQFGFQLTTSRIPLMMELMNLPINGRRLTATSSALSSSAATYRSLDPYFSKSAGKASSQPSMST